MDYTRNQFVRFKTWSSPKLTPERKYTYEDEQYYTSRPSVGQFWRNMQERLDNVIDGVKNFKISAKPSPARTHLAKKNVKPKNVLDPQDRFLQDWTKLFVACCVIAISLDPLFFYIPVVDLRRSCLGLDRTLEIIACVFRTCVDLFYVIHIVFQFRTGFIDPSTRVMGRGVVVKDLSLIAKRYLCGYFIIDILSVLPAPQIILLVAPNLPGPIPLVTKEALKYAVFIQYVPRLIRIYPLFKEVTRTSGIFAERAWTGAAFNLSLYMLASHIVGAFWYLFSFERKERCWRNVIAMNTTLGEDYAVLYCGKNETGVNSFLDGSCALVTVDDIHNNTNFNFGIFLDALQSGVMETKDFPQKFFYCFWWGLRSLSSLGQNLKTSTYVWEIVFAISIAIFGLLLFSLLIGNMQEYLQSETVRVEEMRVKRRDAEQWMAHRMLPEPLRERVRRYEQYKWQETRGVEEEGLIRSLPKDLRRDIKRHLCLDLVTRVPMFEKMDEQLLDAMCDRLKPVLYTEKSFILHEGNPVDEMLFLMRGTSETNTTNGGRTGFFNSVKLQAGDFCGEELLTWALDPNPSPNLPTSTRTVQAVTEVEAFGLMSEDLKFVAAQFRRLHSKQLRHTFKLYSLQWKTWGACFIQAAWRRHCKYKHEKALHEEEERLIEVLAEETEAPGSLRSTLYASKFASNALRALRRNSPTSQPSRLLPLLPPKPAEPDYS